MGSVNKVILIGRLGRDPDEAMTNSGVKVARFSMATDQVRTTNGSREVTTEWHRIVCFGRTAAQCTEYLRKGRLVCVEGQLQTRAWEKSPGDKRYSTEVVASRVTFLDSRNKDHSSQPQDQDFTQESPQEAVWSG